MDANEQLQNLLADIFRRVEGPQERDPAECLHVTLQMEEAMSESLLGPGVKIRLVCKACKSVMPVGSVGFEEGEQAVIYWRRK